MKTITKEELNKILEEHKLWIESNEEEGKRADLSFTILRDLDLKGVDLREATLIGATLSYTDLTGADLIEVDLTESTLAYADLNYADILSSSLRYASLEEANLTGVDLLDSDLTNATLVGADLKRAFLSNINLTNADLRCANLIEVNLSYVILTDTNLSQASTQGIRGLEMYSIDNIGSFKNKVTYLPKYNKVFVGCWEGNLEEFLKKGLEMNEGDNKERTNIVLAYQFFKNQL